MTDILCDENGNLPNVTYEKTLWSRFRDWLLVKLAGKYIVMINVEISGKKGLRLEAAKGALLYNNVFSDFPGYPVTLACVDETKLKVKKAA